MDQHRIKCPYPDCQDFGRVGAGNVVRFGATRQGRQRFLCRSCRRTFSETAGSVFYRLKSPRARVVEAVRLFASGWDVPPIARQMDTGSGTVRDWLTKALFTAGQDVYAELGLTPPQVDNLRGRYVKLRRRRSTTGGGGQTIHSIRLMPSVSH